MSQKKEYETQELSVYKLNKLENKRLLRLELLKQLNKKLFRFDYHFDNQNKAFKTI